MFVMEERNKESMDHLSKDSGNTKQEVRAVARISAATTSSSTTASVVCGQSRVPENRTSHLNNWKSRAGSKTGTRKRCNA